MVFDTRGMVQHYRRIYNAKPSPEIARTRASSGSRKRPATAGASSRGLSRRSTSFQSLNQPAWINDGQNGWSDDGWAGSTNFDGLDDYSRVPRVPRRPYSANVVPQKSSGSFAAPNSGKRGPGQRPARPSSAVAAPSQFYQRKQDPRSRRSRRLRQPGVNVVKLFPLPLTMRPNKLEHLSLETLSSLVLEFEGKARANPIGAPFRCFLLG